MAKKQKNQQQLKRAPTKKQLSRVQQQKKTQRIILIAGSIFLVLVLAFIGYGYYNEQYKPHHSTILKVNGVSFSMNDYLKWLEVYTSGLDRRQATTMASIVPSAMIQSEIIRQYAPELGYTVTEEEIEQGLKEEGVDASEINRSAFEAQLLSEKLLDGYFEQQVPLADNQVNAFAMCLATSTDAEEMRDRINGGEDFEALAGEYSVETLTKSLKGELGWVPESYQQEILGSLSDSVLAKNLFSLSLGTLSEPIYDDSISKEGGYWLLKVTEKDEDISVHVYGMLLGSVQQVEQVRARLVSGEDFAKLAGELSQDTTSSEYGGDLGWMQRDYGNTALVNAAFALDEGDLSDPVYDDTVQTKGGYWIIKILGKEENRALDPDVRDALKQQLFQDWLNEKIESSNIEQMLTAQQQEWALNKVLSKSGA